MLMSLMSSHINSMPALVQHYYHHKIEEGESKLSFIKFLSIHYGVDTSQRDNDDHSDLPFFLFSNECSPLFTHEQNLQVSIEHVNESASLPRLIPQNYNFIISSTIFQPPRFI